MNSLDIHAAGLPGLPFGDKGVGQGSGAQQGQAPSGQRSRQAWLREMERAQLAGWFQPFGTATHDIAQESAKVQMRPAQAGTAGAPDPAAAQRQHPMPAPGPAQARAQARPFAASIPDAAAPAPAFGAAPMEAGALSGSPVAGGRSGAWEPLSPRSGRSSSPGDSSAALAAYAAAGADAASVGDGSAPALGKAMAAAAVQQAPAAPAVVAAAAAQPVASHPLIQIAVPAVPLPAALATALAFLPVRDAAAAAMPILGAERPSPRASQAPGSVPAEPGRAGPSSARWQAAAQAQGMRMHAQWTERGVQLWLGMDGSAQQVGAQAQAVVYSLHRLLREQGQQLSRVVCNGQVVFDSNAARAGAGRALHEFSNLFDRYASARPSGTPAFLPSSSKEIS